MQKKLTFKEKIQVYVKKNKLKTKKQSLILLIITAAFILSYVIFARPTTVDLPKNKAALTASFVGDMMFGRHTEINLEKKGPDYFFEKVQPYFDQSDFVTGNFENPVLLNNENEYEAQEKNIHLASKKEILPSLKKAGFSVINLANNHTMDFGPVALQETLDSFNEYKIPVVGAGLKEENANNIIYTEVDGLTLATVGFTDTYVKGSAATKYGPGVAKASPENIVPTIKRAKLNADYVFVNVHWGIEYNNNPSERQIDIAHAMVEAGADVIAGHHPHVLSNIEVYQDSFIIYSLGNFIFDQGWTRTKDSAIAQFHVYDNGDKELEIIPMRISATRPFPTKSSYYKNKIYRQLTGKLNKEDYEITKESLKIPIK